MALVFKEENPKRRFKTKRISKVWTVEGPNRPAPLGRDFVRNDKVPSFVKRFISTMFHFLAPEELCTFVNNHKKRTFDDATEFIPESLAKNMKKRNMFIIID
ncbi:hypothetical protein CHARACLAT_028626 [Characodon lateralis]|uniref:Uncharacterized protein n=1 Tax=Characodon lateralis TaxID=208331 RepID=A0ABU7DNN8_9TELE|nr:hypothetical protein [Characodon lateralis]